MVVAGRHEVLRTRFVEGVSGPVQVVGDEPAIDFVVRDVSGAGDPDAAALEAARDLAGLPFDLVAGPLMRVVVMRVREGEHVLALSMHHIVSDGWSVGVLLREVQAAYAGRELPALSVQYADYSAWQRTWLDGDVMEEQLAYWREQLAGAPPALDLPTDRPRPATPSHQGAQLTEALDTPTVTRLTETAQQRGTTLFSVLQSVLAAVLSRRSGQDDVVIGVPVANRSRVETEDLIGFFVNTLPLRTRVAAAETFEELLDRVSRTALEGLSHQDVPFDRLVQELAPDRDRSRNPLFQVMLAFQNAPTTEAAPGDLDLTYLPVGDSTAKFDLMLLAEETTGGELSLVLEYSTDLFTEQTARAVLDDIQRACRAAAADPACPVGELAPVSQQENELLRTWNRTDRYDQLNSLIARVREHASTRSDAIALTDDHGSLTYAELAGRASRLTRELLAAGVMADDRVAYHGERGVDAVVAFLGILGAGGAYLPLDPNAPLARKVDMVTASGARHLITTAGQSEQTDAIASEAGRPGQAAQTDAIASAAGTHPTVLVCPTAADGPDELAPVRTAHDDLAYVLYTSGSTGRPKGAMVHHAGMNNHLLAKVDDLALTSGDVIAQNAALIFDISVWQMTAALVAGGRTTIYGDETAHHATD
ncbi:condensation domain-containing protein, partial [Streptomyces sp. NPDC051640]|uniref:condensation domain-containing protein n=2 Tax=unclassified Streptomyces TaxID=2593676 RepID=UPI00379ADF97